eukprot:CAMPEP_0177714920 /NCGR_PEP_ID=MMETSP0484_2-20121128/13708_1 /TAXON_ID=354590 /ORGANISM="Rhodomonas lens, Strain RHODO" /LENGTH=314 /DNA_ID=CAMNT_0019226865 /DNA_START=186 /DNA_END=1130 /DNA_ORIENTATION=-
MSDPCPTSHVRLSRREQQHPLAATPGGERQSVVSAMASAAPRNEANGVAFENVQQNRRQAPFAGQDWDVGAFDTLADVIQQCLEISKRERAPGGVATFGERARDLRDNFDWGRTSRVIAWTGLFGTPICHKWFPMLEKIIPLKGQGAPLIKRVAGRVALDQVVCSPFLTAGFLGFMSVAESGVFDGAVVESKIKDALPVLLPLSWAVWAPVHMLTFSVVPDRMRMLWIGSINLVWGTVMSSYSVTKPPAPSLRLDAPAPPGLLLPVPDAQDTLSASAEVLDAEPLFAHPSGFVLNTEAAELSAALLRACLLTTS